MAAVLPVMNASFFMLVVVKVYLGREREIEREGERETETLL